MKIFHAADLHYSPKHLGHVNKCFGYAIDRAIDEGCELAIIAGDSFDHGMGIHEPAFLSLLHQAHRLADAMPSIWLQGTHSHDKLGALGALKMRDDERILVADEVMVIGVRNGRVTAIDRDAAANEAVVFALPSLNKALPEVRELGPRGWVKQQMGQFAKWAAPCREAGIPVILTSHGTVTGCRTESQYAMVSPDLEFDDLTLYSSGADAVMLGHIHKRQTWQNNQGQIIAYPGSISRLVHGHMDPVGALIWTVSSGRADWVAIDTPAPKLLEADFPGEPDVQELEGLALQVDENTRVRIRYDVDEDRVHMVDREAIVELFKGAMSLKIEPTVHPITSVRSAGIGRAVTMKEKLARVAETTGDSEVVGELAEMAQRLAEISAEEIANTITEEMK